MLRAVKFFKPIFINDIISEMRLGGESDRQKFKAHRECYRPYEKMDAVFLVIAEFSLSLYKIMDAFILPCIWIKLFSKEISKA